MFNTTDDLDLLRFQPYVPYEANRKVCVSAQ